MTVQPTQPATPGQSSQTPMDLTGDEPLASSINHASPLVLSRTHLQTPLRASQIPPIPQRTSTAQCPDWTVPLPPQIVTPSSSATKRKRSNSVGQLPSPAPGSSYSSSPYPLSQRRRLENLPPPQFSPSPYTGHHGVEYLPPPPPPPPLSPPMEKRLRQFRSKPVAVFTKVYQRAVSQRFYVLSRTRTGTADCPEETVELTGSTGNIYTINVGKLPNCNCPHARGGSQCKHVVYVSNEICTSSHNTITGAHSPFVMDQLN